MTLSATTAPVDASQLSDADLYESYRNRGLSHADAVLHVERRRRAANQPVENAPTIPGVSPEQAAVRGAARTATSGFADELVGALEAVRGKPPQNTAQQWFGALAGKDVSGPAFDPTRYAQVRDVVRGAQNQALVEQPGVSMGAAFLGAQVNPLNYLLGPLTKYMTPGQTGVTYGATLLGAQGAGEGESKLGRLTGAAGGAVAGAITGGIGGYIGGKAQQYWKNLWKGVQPLFQRTSKNLTASVGKDVPEEVINGLTETSVRAQLAKHGYKPQDIENAVAIWKNGGETPAPAPPATPVAVRPGETITQTAPKGFEVTGARATPPAPSTPTVAEMMGGAPATPAGATPYDQASAARAAYHLAGAAGQDATAAASRAAGTYSTFDPRQALLLALLLGQRPSQ